MTKRNQKKRMRSRKFLLQLDGTVLTKIKINARRIVTTRIQMIFIRLTFTDCLLERPLLLTPNIQNTPVQERLIAKILNRRRPIAGKAKLNSPNATKIPIVAAGGHKDAAMATPTIETSNPRATMIPAASPPNNASAIIGRSNLVRLSNS